MDSELDFGCFTVGTQVVTKHLPVTNHGSAPVTFQVEYSGDPSVKLSPGSGVIAARSTRWLKVELQTDKPRQINEEAVVKLQNHSDFILSIKAQVVEQNLELSDLKGNKISCLWFGPLYFGTSCVENVVLRNNSPNVSEWFCRLEVTTPGTEMGADMQKSASASLLERMQRSGQPDKDIFDEFLVVPMQGRLAPFEKTTVTLCFSPVFVAPYRYKKHRYSSGQRDYCLFLCFESVITKDGCTYFNGHGGVELPVTGSGLPVSLVPSPSARFDFDCSLGRSKSVLCKLQNLCSQLPVKFRFHKLAHFIIDPVAGTIPAGHSQDIVVTFTARQQGSFQVCQMIDVLGYVMTHKTSNIISGAPELELRSFHKISLQLSAFCNSEVTLPVISRSVNYPTGLRPHVRPRDMSACRDIVYTTVLNADRTQLHMHHRDKNTEEDEFLAFPDDRATSIRPGSPNRQFRTIFTGIRRYNYLDTDYALTKEEVEQRQRNRKMYSDFISQLRISRLQRSKQRRFDGSEVDVDIGIASSNGLVPPKLGIKDMQPNDESLYQLLSRKTFQPTQSTGYEQMTFGGSQLTMEDFDKSAALHSTCIVNKHRPFPIMVQANVVHVSLELSTTLLRLCPTPYLLAASGYHGSVTLRNHHRRPAEFTWQPVVTESGLLFSIRPAKGIVQPLRELVCEVVWHPFYSSPSDGDFDLCVVNGKTQRLHCTAKVGSTSVQLAEYRLIFGSVPLNMPSSRTAVIYNNGQNHAYFKVLDVFPLPGMVVSPSEGVVPSAGQTQLEIQFHPDSVVKFDTIIEIAVRSMKSLQLRIGGSVEPPDVDINVLHFHFDAHVGSCRRLPFCLTNNSSASASVTCDLSEHPDFSLQFPSAMDKAASVTKVVLNGSQTIHGLLVFTPSQPATYEFDLPLMINGVRCPIVPPLPSSSHNVGSSKKNAKQLDEPPTIQVTAIVLCPPLEMFPSNLHFHVVSDMPQDSGLCSQTVELRAWYDESVCGYIVGENMKWWIGGRIATEPDIGEESEAPCVISPSCGVLSPGQSTTLVVRIRPEVITASRVTRLCLSLYLGEEETAREQEQPYRELSITISLQLPSISIHPPQLLLNPVPPKTSATRELTLLASGYKDATSISAEVEDLILENGTSIQPVSVSFLKGNAFLPNEQRRSSLKCLVTFYSAAPLSVCCTITFTDQFNNRFKVKVCATSDNCLLTLWPYLAEHNSKLLIAFKDAPENVEANLQLGHSNIPASSRSSSSSSFFDQISTNKDTISESSRGQGSRDEDDALTGRKSAHLSIPQFPAADTEEGVFCHKVLLAVERWFGLFGYPGGSRPVSIPTTLRRVVPKAQIRDFGGRNYPVRQNKDTRSVVDIVNYLVGQLIPGVPHWPTFSKDTKELTSQLLKHHETMIEFLRIQGASLSHIRPEYLLDKDEFQHWCSLQSKTEEGGLDYSKIDYESLSKRSWTDLMLQIFKVLVLHRVLKGGETTVVQHGEDGFRSKPLVSNVYSSHELKLLSWLNVTYEGVRELVWPAGSAPSARCIMNFDLDLTDGLVIGSLLAAYCPYMIRSHVQRMYTTPRSVEQILHNNIIVTRALNKLSLNMDVQATELSDPNPIQMLMLCVHLYERLPQYLPQKTITLSGALHDSFTKQVNLTNPSSKALKYRAVLLGEDAKLFSLPEGSNISVPPKGSAHLTVQFAFSYLQPKEAVLLLVSTSTTGASAATLSFNLVTCVTQITPTNILKYVSSCYTLSVVHVPIANHLKREAMFKIILVESSFNPLEPDKLKHNLKSSSNADGTSEENQKDETEDENLDPDHYDSEFISAVKCIYLKSGQEDTLTIYFLPFSPGKKYCSVLLVCPQVGDMVYLIKATAHLPTPSLFTLKPSSSSVAVQDNAVLHLCCTVGQVCEEMMSVPLVNMAWEQALSMWGQLCMSADEYRRRMLTHTLHSSTLRATTAARKFHKQFQKMKYFCISKERVYNVEVSSPKYFTLPKTVTIPVKDDSKISWDKSTAGCLKVPVRFQADSVGHYPCQVVLRSWSDTRVYAIKALVAVQTI
ncbi:cilia- and flagella-associated protein 47-like [Synchiropus splendidus]|uniref:cilia- and flagella-associated protein 47-like n=1 Tax=Synchiropus splendidus TaxID=270530 RepID=UPI00237D5DF6|nr:cilia- and flagella-associated protein 47-like [Synchiropus splendidus]XP_053738275.1 cilia- and flagella-associated protein 47-like [Synchiropus splendidus]